MSAFFEDPGLYRFVLENLSIGIYALDREQKVRFWNRGAEQITGYLAHEVMGQVCRESLPHCDAQGRVLAGSDCSITTTFREGRAVQSHVFTLHKEGHRLGVQIRTLPLVDGKGLTMGVAIAFEEGRADTVAEAGGALLCGCLDPVTGVSAQRLTRAVLTDHGWGLLRIHVLGLKEMVSRYGADSVAAFLRTTAQTVRHSLGAEDFLGRWGAEDFLVMLQTPSPVKVTATAELIARQISQSEVVWWGDRFRVRASVEWAIAGPDGTLDTLLGDLRPLHEPAHAAAQAGSSQG